MKAVKVIGKILEIIIPVIKNRENGEMNFPVDFTFFHVLERVRLNLESIQILVNDSILNHDHAIGLISRNLISDFILTGYVLKLSTSQEEYYTNLYSIYNSDLKKMDSIMKMFKDAGLISDNEMKKFDHQYSNDKHMYKIIRDYADEYDLKSFPSIRSIIEKFLKADKKDVWVNQVQNSYNLWVQLSKYEHLGWNSYDFTRKIDLKRTSNRLMSVLFKTLILTGSCLETLREEQALTEIMNLIDEYKEPNKA